MWTERLRRQQNSTSGLKLLQLKSLCLDTMATFVVRILSITLGLFFIFVGLLKITPSINKELYKEMRKQYIRMAKVFPLHSLTGWKPDPHVYRKVVASSEITCGVLLAVIPGPLKIAANVYMIALMANDVLAHAQIKHGIQRMSLPVVFILLLTCRLIIFYQEKSREEKLAKEKKEREAKQKEAKEKPTGETKEETQQAAGAVPEPVSAEEKKQQ